MCAQYLPRTSLLSFTASSMQYGPREGCSLFIRRKNLLGKYEQTILSHRKDPNEIHCQTYIVSAPQNKHIYGFRFKTLVIKYHGMAIVSVTNLPNILMFPSS